MHMNLRTDARDSFMCANGSLPLGFMNKVSVRSAEQQTSIELTVSSKAIQKMELKQIHYWNDASQ